jgi:hypothetical protein
LEPFALLSFSFSPRLLITLRKFRCDRRKRQKAREEEEEEDDGDDNEEKKKEKESLDYLSISST